MTGFGSAYFRFHEAEGEESGCAKILLFPQDYKSAFNSKASEDSLATFAGWEFGHGEFKFGHPWKQYLKVGGLARECASHLQVLSGYLNADEDDLKTQTLLSFKSKIQEPCTRMCSESSQALKDISSVMKTMAHPSPAIQDHLRNSRAAINDLEVVFRSSSLSTTELLSEIIPCAAVMSILIDIVNCVDKISKSVDELSEKAGFKKPKAKSPIVTPVKEDSPEGEVVAVTIDERPQDSPEFDNLQGGIHEQKSQELTIDVKTG
nr:aluminum-activated malate transporter 8-like [Ipomoea batatas]